MYLNIVRFCRFSLSPLVFRERERSTQAFISQKSQKSLKLIFPKLKLHKYNEEFSLVSVVF